MGTRSVITTNPEADGRYVHWDGYPTGVGAALLAIVKRDGIETARRVLTVEHFGWSSVTGREPEPNDSHKDPARFEVVPGYGIAYTHAEHRDEWAQPVDSEEYGYVLGDTHLTILDGDRLTNIAYDLPDDEQANLINVFENGA